MVDIFIMVRNVDIGKISEKQKTCTNTLIAEKTRLSDGMAKLLEKISEILEKNFVKQALKKKDLKKLQAGPYRYIKTISFSIYPYQVQLSKS